MVKNDICLGVAHRQNILFSNFPHQQLKIPTVGTTYSGIKQHPGIFKL